MNVEISLVGIDVDVVSWQGKDEDKTLIENIRWEDVRFDIILIHWL